MNTDRFFSKGSLNIDTKFTNQPTRVITIGLNLNDPHFDYSIKELNALAQANHMQVVTTVTQKLDHPFAGTYFGPGKIKSLKEIAEAQKAQYIIVNDELTPSQIRNLEKMTGKDIIDRTGLILEIFANQARTKEAKLQVKLARLEYQLPRLRTSASVRLDQQTGNGGGYTNRGSGETLLEMRRRTLGRQINNIRHHLKSVNKTKKVQSHQRKKMTIPTVALVGYTNAGKSTILNQLVKRWGTNESKRALVKNMLFATLSTEVRKLTLPNNRKFLLSDTVGFVSKLPHELISAFQSTLSEAANADLLIQVVDYSDPNRQLMMKTTMKTLKKMGIHGIPMITVFNKADKVGKHYPVQEGNSLIMSAQDPTNRSINALVKMIEQRIYRNYITVNLVIPYNQGQIISYLNTHADVLKAKYSAKGTQIKVNLPKPMLDRISQYQI
nr:GTPase HflX [Acetilactobacillus jinshanensis]